MIQREIPVTGCCAHCVREREDLELTEWDGGTVWMCGDCREGSLRGSSYTFAGPSGADSRVPEHNGNRRIGSLQPSGGESSAWRR